MPIDRATLARLRKKLRFGLVGVAVALTNEGKKRATARVDTGELRNSITHAEIGDNVYWGIPRNKKNEALEGGFKPHFVPIGIIGTWARRKGVGTVTVKGARGRKRKFLAAGVYVGGPNSRLDYGRGFVGGFYGGRYRTWRTKGSSSEFLRPGTVGFSVVQHTVKNDLQRIAPVAFAAGYDRG